MKKREMYESLTRRITGLVTDFDGTLKNHRIRVEMLEAEVSQLQAERKAAGSPEMIFDMMKLPDCPIDFIWDRQEKSVAAPAPAPAPELPKRWDDLKKVNGWYVDEFGLIKYTSMPMYKGSIMFYSSEKEAESVLAMAQLSQLMKVYRAGWEPVKKEERFSIFPDEDGVLTIYPSTALYYLSFPTQKLADQFLTNFKDLINKYFML